MSDIEYPAKKRYKDRSVADAYDAIRFRSLKGYLTDKLEKSAIQKAIDRTGIAHGSCILDVPCGTGRISEMLLKQGHAVTAGDISEEMMAHAKKRTSDFESQIIFNRCDIENLEFENNSFELIVTLRLLHHIPPALHEKILKELNRVTNKWLILSYSNKYTLQNLRRNFIAFLKKTPRFSISGRLFKQEIKKAGFKIVSYNRIAPLFSETIIVLLEKQ